MSSGNELGRLLQLERARLPATESLDECASRVVDTEPGAHESERDDGDVDGLLVPAQRVALEAQVEVARPDERQHVAGDTSDEAHQYGEVRQEDGHDESEADEPEPQHESPDLQRATGDSIGVSAAAGSLLEAGRAGRRGAPTEEAVLQQLHRGEVGQRVGQQRLDDEEQVDEYAHRHVRQVVRDHLLRLEAERQEADVGEAGFEDGGGDVRPMEHALEARPVDELALERRQEDLRRVAEHDDAERDRERVDVDAHEDLVPLPLGGARQAVDEYDGVDEHVSDGAPEAEQGHALQGAQEGARQQHGTRQHRPAAQVQGSVRKAADEKVSALQENTRDGVCVGRWCNTVGIR